MPHFSDEPLDPIFSLPLAMQDACVLAIGHLHIVHQNRIDSPPQALIARRIDDAALDAFPRFYVEGVPLISSTMQADVAAMAIHYAIFDTPSIADLPFLAEPIQNAEGFFSGVVMPRLHDKSISYPPEVDVDRMLLAADTLRSLIPEPPPTFTYVQLNFE